MRCSIQQLIHEADGRLKFWKMITPRRASEDAENKVYRYSPFILVMSSVNEKGELVEGHGEYAKKFLRMGYVIRSAKLSHFGMVTDEMRYINEQQLRRMSFLPYKKRI